VRLAVGVSNGQLAAKEDDAAARAIAPLNLLSHERSDKLMHRSNAWGIVVFRTDIENILNCLIGIFNKRYS
jgi:hypothetical protein